MKTLIGLFTALLMSAGLIAVTPPAASAAGCDSYTGCVDTKTTASAPRTVARRSRATVCGTVVTVASNATPRGDLRFTVTRSRGKFKFSKTIPYDGGKMCAVTRKLKRKGAYTVHVAFLPQKKSVFSPSDGSTRFRVTGR